MRIEKIKIKNFKCFGENFEANFKSGVNIIVGNNESGKSTILEAVHLALTGMLNGRYLRNELSSYLFNMRAEQEYVASLETVEPQMPPEIVIELYLTGDGAKLAELEGNGNSEKKKASGIRFKIEFDENNTLEYNALVQAKNLKSIPMEYYKVSWSSFARQTITGRSIALKSALIDSSSSRAQNGSDIYISRIIKENLEDKERVSISQAHRQMREAFMKDENVRAINSKINEAARDSRGDVFDRISKVYKHIYVDEVQDLAGYDLDVLAQFFLGDSNILLVGDPRQVTYQTHHERRYTKYSGGKLLEFFEAELPRKTVYEVDESTLSVSHRNSDAICAVSSKLFPAFGRTQACTCEKCRNDKPVGSGLFVVPQARLTKYLDEFLPVQLRHNATSKGVSSQLRAVNFGEAKGLGFDRVLIYPTSDMVSWMKDNSSVLKDQTRAKFYVALTRARHSVAIVHDFKTAEVMDGFKVYE